MAQATNKKVTAVVKIQLPAGQAKPGQQIGSALGSRGVNSAQFIKEFNDRTAKDAGMIVPVIITVYADKTYTFVTKTPPATYLIKKACGIEKGSGNTIKNKVAKITEAQVEEIAKMKMADLNATDLEAAKKIIKGSCRSIGVEVVD